MKKYQKIVADILYSINISKENIEKLFIHSNHFRDAFVSSSADPIHNYEYLELKGDCIVNLAIAQYIKKRFPLITSQKWITKLYHNLRSTKYLSMMAKDLKFDECILYGNQDKKDINKILEDCFEAFFGALVTITEKLEYNTGYYLSYSIISTLYDSYDLPLDFDKTFEYKPRVKEIFDTMKWNFKKEMVYFDRNQNKNIATLEIFPKGDRTPIPENSVKIEGFSYHSREEAVNYLYKFVLGALKKYGIEEKVVDPYHINVDVEKLVPYPPDKILPSDLKDKIRISLTECFLSDELVDKFIRNEYLIEFRKCFIDESFDPYNNMDAYSFEGSSVLDCVIVSYISKKLLHSENLVTHAKHNIMSKSGIFEKIFNIFEFEKYLLISSEIEIDRNSQIYKKIIISSFKSFVGCIANILDKNVMRGIGYASVYNFMSKYLDKINLSQDITKHTSFKSQLKEHYDKNRSRVGQLKDNIIYSLDEDTKIHYIKIRYGDKIISEAKSNIKVNAVEEASKIALQKLGILKK